MVLFDIWNTEKKETRFVAYKKNGKHGEGDNSKQQQQKKELKYEYQFTDTKIVNFLK